MGTKVQSENYLSLNHLMRNMNEDPSGHFPHSSDDSDETLSDDLYDGCMLTPVNGYSAYDREMLKQAMLEHEAVFRKQVWELHRLYRIQKSLMDELKNQDLYQVPVEMETSGCYTYSSQMSYETKQNIWQMPHLTTINTSYNREAVVGTDNVNPSLNLMQSNEVSTEKGSSLAGGKLLDCKLKNHPKRTIDLQLPADVYIDTEDSERTNREDMFRTSFRATGHVSSVYDVEDEREVKLTLGISGDPSCSYSTKKFDRQRQSRQSINSLGGLNRPVKGLNCEGESGLVSNHSTGVRTLHGCHQLPDRMDGSFLPRDLFTENHSDEGAYSKIVSAVKEENVWESSPLSYEDGRSRNGTDSLYPGISSDKYPLCSGPSRQKLERDHETSPDQSEEQTRFGEKTTLGIRTSVNSSQLAKPGDSLLTSPQVHNPLSCMALMENTSFESSLRVACLRRPSITYVPIAVQALPCFSEAERIKYRTRKLHKSVKDLVVSQDKMEANGDLNQSQSGFDRVAHDDFEGNGSLRCCKSPKDVSFSQLIPSATQGEKHRESIHMQVKERKKRRKGTSHGRKNIIGFPNAEKLQQGQKCVKKKVKNEVGDVDMIREGGVGGSCRLGFQNQINLNSQGILTKDEVDAQTGQIVSEIAMEAFIPFKETLDSMAAENIVAISLDLIHPSAPVSCDSLHWFSVVISSETACAETPNSDGTSKGLDLFEAMTLELDEVKPDVYGLRSQQQGNQKKGNKHSAKRRQKKDFQKDILPGLMSLSRHEVNEDLQAFETMMKATDSTWQPSMVRRGTGRKGFSCQGRGRQQQPQATSLAIVVADVTDIRSSPPRVKPLVPTEVGDIDRSKIGQGRGTEKGRKHRVKSGNAFG
ncbi:uncharacterized protein M6B38_365270 [Iris pallida]|uniref:Uncharacterized protein n=1 Tax=Iris pallida TaxID=29817 RepID=A0AAX6GGL9_IRIPA|nr:uncharacterized protein M6B38_365270 [Iris pallida]